MPLSGFEWSGNVGLFCLQRCFNVAAVREVHTYNIVLTRVAPQQLAVSSKQDDAIVESQQTGLLLFEEVLELLLIVQYLGRKSFSNGFQYPLRLFNATRNPLSSYLKVVGKM